MHLQAKEVTKRAAITVTSKKMVTAIVRAYVYGAADAQILALFNQNITTSDARTVYEDQVIGNLTQLKDPTSNRSTPSTRRSPTSQPRRAKAEHQSVVIKALLAQNVENENATRATLEVVTKKLKTEIIAYEIRVGVAAARAKNTAGEEAAVAAASAVGGQVPRTKSSTPSRRPCPR